MPKFSRFHLASAVLAGALALLAGTRAEAGSASGTIAVALNVSDACVVNGATAFTTTLGQVGAISFADQPGLFGDINASMIATGGGNAISVLCSPGLSPTLSINAGLHDASSLHHLASGSNLITYHLYSDSGHTNEIHISQSLSLGTTTSSAINVPIYAVANSGGQVMPAGAYTDTVQVTLSW